MPEIGGLQWIRPPLQSRSQQTLYALLDAAERLLVERPFGAISVQEITKTAGSSVGAFYARFPDKMAVLHSLHERYVEEARATAEAALQPQRWESVSLGQILSQLCAFLVETADETAGVRRGALLAAIESPVFAMRAEELREAIIDALVALLEERKHEVSHPHTQRAAAFVYRLLFGLLDQRALFGPHSDEDTHALAEDICRSITAFLGVEWEI